MVGRLRDGGIAIIFTVDEAQTFIAQGEDSAFKGNDLLYPAFEDVKQLMKGESNGSDRSDNQGEAQRVPQGRSDCQSDGI